MIFTGVGVALATLFDSQLRVDVEATADHAARMADCGIAAIVLAGTTGEAFALSPEERFTLVAGVRRAVPASVPVIAGTGAPSAHGAVAFTKQAVEAGADAVLVLSPAGSTDLLAYYESVASEAGGRPVLGYHFPKVPGPGIPVEALDALPLDGCKDSSGDAGRLLAEVTTVRLPVFVGAAPLLALGGPLGVAGAILALANVQPELCIAAFGGDIDAQRRLASSHFRTSRPIGVGLKAEMAERWGTSAAARIH